MTDAPHLSPEELLALVPTAAIQPRTESYRGDSVAVSLTALDPSDVPIVHQIYEFLGALHVAHDAATMAAVLAAYDLHRCVANVRQLGTSLTAEDLPLDVRKAYHDIRGGSLSALLLLLDGIHADDPDPSDVEQVFMLVRDHRKILRNVLPDLDPEGYARDLSPCDHDASLLAAKWAGASYQTAGAKPVHIRFACDFRGGVSECCMEFAALDRVIYNLINNAARFTADATVDLTILPLSSSGATDLRFVIVNQITAEHQERLRSDIGDDLSPIFLPRAGGTGQGYTTGGHGVGLQICGDFITHGYGLNSVHDALRDGYLGARLVRDCFVTWFHWPGRHAADAATASA